MDWYYTCTGNNVPGGCTLLILLIPGHISGKPSWCELSIGQEGDRLIDVWLINWLIDWLIGMMQLCSLFPGYLYYWSSQCLDMSKENLLSWQFSCVTCNQLIYRSLEMIDWLISTIYLWRLFPGCICYWSSPCLDTFKENVLSWQFPCVTCLGQLADQLRKVWTRWLIDWLVGQLGDQLREVWKGWLIDWLIDWLVQYIVDPFSPWMLVYLILPVPGYCVYSPLFVPFILPYFDTTKVT